MALIFHGQSTCSICGGILQKTDQIVAFAAFIADKGDPLWRYSDSAMHETCVEEWVFRDEFLARYESAREWFRRVQRQYPTLEALGAALHDGHIEYPEK
ncbi:MAG: hypothetical protein CMJ58_24020 [Planctomycetaceae bacterium]|nr:hypothetical protein [Planctomycetaceae bacterium]